jgi:hypothetical protein
VAKAILIGQLIRAPFTVFKYSVFVVTIKSNRPATKSYQRSAHRAYSHARLANIIRMMTVEKGEIDWGRKTSTNPLRSKKRIERHLVCSKSVRRTGKVESLGNNHLMLERVPQKFSIGADVEGFHHSILVKGYGSRFDVDYACHLFHRQALGE